MMRTIRVAVDSRRHTIRVADDGRRHTIRSAVDGRLARSADLSLHQRSARFRASR
jgi:hypothetical protein